MELKGKRMLVIGGAGFIGCHIVDQLIETDVKEIIIYDNFFRGTMDNIEEALKDPRVTISLFNSVLGLSILTATNVGF